MGAQPYQGRELAFKLGLEGDQIKQFVKIFQGLAALFQDLDLALLEINPLVITDEGNYIAWTLNSLSIAMRCIASQN